VRGAEVEEEELAGLVVLVVLVTVISKELCCKEAEAIPVGVIAILEVSKLLNIDVLVVTEAEMAEEVFSLTEVERGGCTGIINWLVVV
jgi:hypothetical protein